MSATYTTLSRAARLVFSPNYAPAIAGSTNTASGWAAPTMRSVNAEKSNRSSTSSSTAHCYKKAGERCTKTAVSQRTAYQLYLAASPQEAPKTLRERNPNGKHLRHSYKLCSSSPKNDSGLLTETSTRSRIPLQPYNPYCPPS
ncbi:hypothetical protein MPH_10158 [Macrophomina phaseolina MS6]|uniref:Uncharacterized protein n=1 Tax=Macrophomina phaseolina (strain MS6) TaxID=1126212 RepID=K2RR77_MACPH|nr:hypothetical protein MPH_10158 [Macrophomina phaseolina MS6]